MNVMKEICELAVERYGPEAQMNQAIEELNELAVAINHYRRGRIGVAKVAEEIADVCISLEQLEQILCLEEKDIVEACAAKLTRLKERLQREVTHG